MRAVSFMYHDILESGIAANSGCPKLSTLRYSLDRAEFESHLAALYREGSDRPLLVQQVLQGWPGRSVVMLTFDDGHISAKSVVLDVLARYGWRAHFFIATDYIGQKNYLSSSDIRLLQSAGHLIGTHTRSHPTMMSAMSWDTMVGEWRDSVARLEDILGGSVTVGSVPGGYYSEQVAKAASRVGLRALFTSVPTSSVRSVDNCRVFGRHAILAGIPHEREATLVQNHFLVRSRVRAAWIAKQAAKGLLGSAYLPIRHRALQWLAH